MAQIQRYFDEFHKAIALGRFDEEATLREKRDIIRNKLQDKLPAQFEEAGEESPSFGFADQGSYALGTGIKPVSGDYDIDQGLYFDVTENDYPDPIVLKKRVRDALQGQTKSVAIRRSCVTVFYQREGEEIYHVDLAVYRSPDAGGAPKLAKGKEFSQTENKFWELSDQSGFVEWVRDGFDEDGRSQLRRLIRYMKRWKDERFDSTGNGAPTGIALTVALRSSFSPHYSDTLARKADDLAALKSGIDNRIAQFSTYVDGDGASYHRTEVRLPVQPYCDLLERLTDAQSENLYQRLLTLREALVGAQQDVDPVEACTKLRGEFGDDFPVPEPEDTASKAAPTILGSSASA